MMSQIDITKLFIKPTAHNSSIQASDKLLPIWTLTKGKNMTRKYSIQDANFACAEELQELHSISHVASCNAQVIQ